MAPEPLAIATLRPPEACLAMRASAAALAACHGGIWAAAAVPPALPALSHENFNTPVTPSQLIFMSFMLEADATERAPTLHLSPEFLCSPKPPFKASNHI